MDNNRKWIYLHLTIFLMPFAIQKCNKDRQQARVYKFYIKI